MNVSVLIGSRLTVMGTNIRVGRSFRDNQLWGLFLPRTNVLQSERLERRHAMPIPTTPFRGTSLH